MDSPPDRDEKISALVMVLLLELVRERGGPHTPATKELLDQLRTSIPADTDPALLIAGVSAAVMRMVFEQNGGDVEEILQSIIIHGSGA
jgi:hypothetical protein